jgi:hypothetical protein
MMARFGETTHVHSIVRGMVTGADMVGFIGAFAWKCLGCIREWEEAGRKKHGGGFVHGPCVERGSKTREKNADRLNMKVCKIYTNRKIIQPKTIGYSK